ncbi:MAG: T9SS type A sorting domain-containing protein [Porphyromonadaceae bacterium]|nr:T9SS type A sorting domain-containing protein [Porphyromonadaceae bacterium]
MIRKITLLIPLLFFTVLSSFSQRTVIEVTGSVVSTASYKDAEVIINGKTDLHITATTSQLENSIVKLNSEESWLFFDNVRPKYVLDNLLSKIFINGEAASYRNNCRVSIYKHGTVVIPQGSSFQPLTVFDGQNYTGQSNSNYSLYVYNNALGDFDNKIRSFKLKRGYMATFATSSDGLGYSRVFIADSKDLEVPLLPDLLDNKISFIRVFQWEWPTKKGWAGSDPGQYTPLNVTWRYDWSASGSTTSAVEYVPIKQNAGWPGWGEINGKQNVTHLLGFNEPNRPDQSNMTVEQALAIWPEYMKSGLRLGSPSPSDPFGSNGAWLYEFLDSCKARNYRVDYVAIHAYWAKSPQQWYNDLKWVHEKTGLPIWITEWNNGANWTNEWWPTADRSLSPENAAKQLNDIKGILNVLDTTSFVERYSIYNWVQDCRAMALGSNLTPAGEYYAANKSRMAYNPKYEVIPSFRFRNPSLAIAFGAKNLTLTINDPNYENFIGAVVERSIEDGAFEVIYDSNDGSLKSFVDTLDNTTYKKVRYRTRSKFSNGKLSAFSNEVGYDVTSGDDIQIGKIGINNTGWNALNFIKPYNTVPNVILGGATNNNFTALVAARSKLVSGSTRVNIQLAPWSYQKISSYSREDYVSYFILAGGEYDFGGLKAQSGRVAVGPTWIRINFPTPFETVPVVFASQLLANSTFATTVRVRNVTTTGFEAILMKEEAITTSLGSEQVSYLAIETGSGTVNGNPIIVGRTADNFVGATYKTINYGETITNPVFIAQMQTANDQTTSVLRSLAVADTYANIVKQRERSKGVLTVSNEMAGWLVTSAIPNIPQGTEKINLPAFSIFPNPVKDKIFFSGLNGNDVIDVEIYNMTGILMKSTKIIGSEVDVNELPAGYYFLKTKNRVPTKFVKL